MLLLLPNFFTQISKLRKSTAWRSIFIFRNQFTKNWNIVEKTFAVILRDEESEDWSVDSSQKRFQQEDCFYTFARLSAAKSMWWKNPYETGIFGQLFILKPSVLRVLIKVMFKWCKIPTEIISWKLFLISLVCQSHYKSNFKWSKHLSILPVITTNTLLKVSYLDAALRITSHIRHPTAPNTGSSFSVVFSFYSSPYNVLQLHLNFILIWFVTVA